MSDIERIEPKGGDPVSRGERLRSSMRKAWRNPVVKYAVRYGVLAGTYALGDFIGLPTEQVKAFATAAAAMVGM